MPQYVLARHVFVCVQGEHVVFLDVRKDRYFALESARTSGLGCLVPGWPVPAQLDYVRHDAGATAPALAEQVNLSALSGVISLLLEKGILVPEPDGKPADATVVQPMRGDLTAEALDDPPRFGLRLFLRFVSAAVGARLLLKHRTFEAVVGRVRHRTEQGRNRAGSAVSETDLRHLVASFSTLRPFFFAAKDACLFDTLALSEFLAAYGVYPSWFFGVQSRPFAAHCWLQLDGVVLNDTVDHVQRYTPIMVV